MGQKPMASTRNTSRNHSQITGNLQFRDSRVTSYGDCSLREQSCFFYISLTIGTRSFSSEWNEEQFRNETRAETGHSRPVSARTKVFSLKGLTALGKLFVIPLVATLLVPILTAPRTSTTLKRKFFFTDDWSFRSRYEVPSKETE